MSDRRVLVTGVTGFVGYHLAEDLSFNGWSVIGAGRDAEPGPVEHLLADYLQLDLTDRSAALPDADGVIHLAGLADVGPSFGAPQRYISSNSAMMTTVGESWIARGSGRVVVVSSGAVYQAPTNEGPLTEDSPLGFASPYSVSKVLVENQAAYYRTRGVDAVVARPFNHIGPGQRAGFLVPDLIASIDEAQASSTPIVTGDLDTVRDYTDVRDVARAYRLLLEAPRLRHSVYNVCSGRGTSGRDLLDLLTEGLGASNLPQFVDPARRRPNDARRIVGSSERLREELGWAPSIPLTATVDDVLRAGDR